MQKKYSKSFDGAKIFYHKTQNDPKKWLIFLHGLGGDLTAWEKERRYFDHLGISTLAIDLRGHGLSERGKNKNFYKLKNHIYDVKVILEKEQIQKPVIVGHCFGGMVSINYGAYFPREVDALVLVDTSYKLPFFSKHKTCAIFLENILEQLAKISPERHIERHTHFKNFYDTSDVDFRRLLSDVLHASIKSYLFLCSNLIEYDAESLLKKIVDPTLVVEGTRDSIFPPKIAALLKERLINSEMDLIPEANHILIINSPKELNQTIDSYLKKISFLK
ncbi:hypothetical protein A2X44_03780 [candidate division CPR3 bacterium GWF2_35_18]|uniref:Carboxylesterase (Est-1) n=1 Tax=candidate division CPR3 bacterium GW2011_GWF2_35_18 TaxID=1618350 RepID=A0A0G0BJP9_UNCC3|nr:MAG: Carboxylesterase (Est-1) [candidate division CPR3 bacterium GW2011_GWF2_35_18]KKP85622.1 MAG: Carboxylesterase (Est-1) [candidate division CPR3 bacterium GW2011_GWE2_35_7]OGB63131.1 MAG: hypothetical protein A2X44_03780 [candidate division CPR3 bacterium GWF2_35_18]OGB64055.1 MAG: hypothetical protein A2250_04610 [candidate division CPR3 bacterium RIFOXYA2_FULL_35_13]OGB76048.1 MAG: hypothetical protein A2476_04450 [candidate division CPR3 bacterium RIFOXYC2_FULL_35_7]OGB78221.1 MAG: h